MAFMARFPMHRICKCIFNGYLIPNKVFGVKVPAKCHTCIVSSIGRQFHLDTRRHNIENVNEDIQPEVSQDKDLQSTKSLRKRKPLHKRGPLEPFQELQDKAAVQTEFPNNHLEAAEFVDDLAPPPPVSFNLAGYVNNSSTLQELVKLGVNLSEIEQKPIKAKYVLRLDFDKHIKQHLQFLHDNGVPAESLGYLITKNPLIFKVDLDDMQIRVNYLKSKKFSNDAIARIISNNPFYLSLGTKTVDKRLGFYQRTFHLTGDEVRYLITKRPKLVTFEYEKLQEKIFVLREEMCFTEAQMKKLLLMKPKVWMLGRKALTERFQLVHSTMGIPQERILEYPGILLKRGFLLKQRHQYLEHLGRAQYDPAEPGFVSLHDLATTTDYAFCKICALTSTDAYNEFLKTV